jgi:ParB/RepB/Spo0J family partition protein
MTLTNRYKRIPLTQIDVPRDERQRREIDVEDLIPSVRMHGVIQPIIVEEVNERYLLVAGERRYTASIKIGIPDIPARLASELTAIERQILELEENVKRQDLPWKDQVRAIRRIHDLYASLTEGWTQEQTADAIGMTQSYVSVTYRVAEELDTGNTLVESAPGIRAAYNIITRHDERRLGDVMNDLLEDKPVPKPHVVHVSTDPGYTHAPPPLVELPVPYAESIGNDNFLKWVQEYNGRPFSFIHCDFPYGIEIDRSEQANTQQWGAYEDSDDTYWRLCKALCDNLDKLMTQQGHLFFWLPSDIWRQYETLDFFEKNAPSLEFVRIPLVWHKTDNRGILSDPRRRARHVYESALYASRGGRLIVKSVSDTYGAPTSKEVHQSEKPEPMLRHFFQMFVDEFTRMLDPTCGSGTALRAAESLGATHVLGLEINSSFCDAARTLLRKSRNLRALDKRKVDDASQPLHQSRGA